MVKRVRFTMLCNLTNIAKGQTKKKKSSQTYDYHVGDWFGVAKESLGSYYFLHIKDNLTEGKWNVIKLYR